MNCFKVFLMVSVLLLVACDQQKTLPNVTDASYYQDVLLSFAVDEKDPALLRMRRLAQDKHLLRVGLNTQTPPFVMADTDGKFHGLSVDYLHRITELTEQEIQWIPYHQLSTLLKDLKRGKIDVAAGGITDTQSRRDQGMLFVPELRQDELAILTGFAKDTQVSKELYALIVFFVLSLMIYTTLNYRKLKHEDMTRMHRFATAFHETVAVHYSRDAKIPWHSTRDKLLDAFQLIKGPAFLSLIITFAVVDYLRADYEVKNISDLQNKVVVTKAGTNTVRLLEQAPVQVDELRDAVMLFLQGDADVVVHDASMLRHYEHIAPQNFRVIRTGKNLSHTGFVLRDAQLALVFQEAVEHMFIMGEYDMLLYGYALK
ncbi:MAG: transporter substrate-binding domain-containing protein [Mariprofundaceae bacterium]|nr:transporter substrate-binding domain-containing protein [Mariprofundaceae bacterium]